MGRATPLPYFNAKQLVEMLIAWVPFSALSLRLVDVLVFKPLIVDKVAHIVLGLSSVEDLILNCEESYDLIYIDPPFGLQREFHMTESDGTKKSWEDSWSNYEDY
ncbi:MAG: hypothetical protein QF709_05305, partial [Candidatus Thalassarchaeum sp.]|nr:hypothetical protein [Candidatus Thalassarchaeum sp.]